MKTIRTDCDAYEFVVEKLLNQYDKSVDLNQNCQYRGYSIDQVEQWYDESLILAKESLNLKEDLGSSLSSEFQSLVSDILSEMFASSNPNLACAAGHLINDIYYDQNFEGKTLAPTLDTDKCPIAESIQKSHPEWNYTINSHEMVRNLQSIHDHEEVCNWEHYFSQAEFNSDGSYVGGLGRG